MAEIFRLLFVILLLNVYWIPSDEAAGDTTPEAKKENFIAELITTYVMSGCIAAHREAFRDAGIRKTARAEVLPFRTPGQEYIIKRLSTFFSTGCTVGGDVENISNSHFSPGERQIINLLSVFISSGCSVAAKINTTLGTGKSGPVFTPGEKDIINQISSYFLSGCPKPRVSSGKSGQSDAFPPDSPDGGQLHVRSTVLELLLLVLGVFLKRILL